MGGVDGELALPNHIPKLDGVVPRPRHNLTVVGGKGHRQAVLGVPHKLVLAVARDVLGVSLGTRRGPNVPQTQGCIPGG